MLDQIKQNKKKQLRHVTPVAAETKKPEASGLAAMMHTLRSAVNPDEGLAMDDDSGGDDDWD